MCSRETYTKPDRKRKNYLIFEYEKHIEQTPSLKAGLSNQTNREEDVDTIAVITEESAETDIKMNECSSTTICSDAPKSFENLIENRTVDVETKLVESPAKSAKNLTNMSFEYASTRSDVIEEATTSKETYEGPPPLDITEKVDVSKNMDLFKAIFLSDDDDDDSNTVEEINTIEEPAKADIIEDLLPRFKPTKEGLLSNINFSHKFTPKQQKTKEPQQIEEETKTIEDDVNIYGPKLPTNKITIAQSQSNLTSKSKSSKNEIWVEKDAVKLQHKDKKHKKDKKKKHKKH